MRRYPRVIALPPFCLAVACVWLALYLHRQRVADPLDTQIALLIGAGWTVGVAFMVLETEGWTVRALGVLGAICGDAVLYWYIAGQRWDIDWLTPGQLEGFLDLARAFLLVGMPLFILGIAATIREKHRHHHPEDPADEPRATGLP